MELAPDPGWEMAQDLMRESARRGAAGPLPPTGRALSRWGTCGMLGSAPGRKASAAIAAVALAVSLVLALRTVGPERPVALVWVLLEVAPLCAIGVALVAQRSDSVTARLVLALGLVLAVGTGAEAVLHLLRTGTPAPVVAALRAVHEAAVPAAVSCFAALVLLFPHGRAGLARRRLLAALGGVVLLLTSLAVVAPADYPDHGLAWQDLPVRNPLAVAALQRFGGAQTAAVVVAGAALLAGLLDLAVRRRRAAGRQRAVLGWGLGTVALVLTEWAAGFLCFLSGVISFRALNALPCLFLVPIGLGVAVLRHDALEIDVLTRLSLACGSATLLITGGYVAVVALAGSAATVWLPVSSVLLLAAGAMLVVVPLRQWTTALIRRRVYGPRLSAMDMLARFGATLEDAYALPNLATRLAATVREGLGLGGRRCACSPPPNCPG